MKPFVASIAIAVVLLCPKVLPAQKENVPPLSENHQHHQHGHLSSTGDSEEAENSSTTEVQLLETNHEPNRKGFWVTTLQHFSTWSYGSQFFFLDILGAPNFDFYTKEVGLYLEYSPVFSLNRIIKFKFPRKSILQSVGLTPQLNYGRTPEGAEINRVFLEGVDLGWKVPGFTTFDTQLLARQERLYSPAWQFTVIYTAPFSIGRTDWLFWGFWDHWQRVGIAKNNTRDSFVLLAQPQLLISLDCFSHKLRHLMIGFELEPSHDYPIVEVHKGWNFAWSPMIRWFFAAHDKEEK